MLFNPFRKRKADSKTRPLDRILDRLVAMGPGSTNCSLIKTAAGQETNEDLGRAAIFKYEQKFFVYKHAFYISTPDGIKAEGNSLFTGQRGEILHLWFLYNRIPYTVDCQLLGRVPFSKKFQQGLDPRIPVGYMLRPVGSIRNNDKRESIRYVQKQGSDQAVRVYPQIRFDVFVTQTELRFPESGSLPSYVSGFSQMPYEMESELHELNTEEAVQFLKNSLRALPRKSRVVHVSKPYKDEQAGRTALMDLDRTEVLGLETSGQDAGVFYIRKPPKMNADKRSPMSISDRDTVILGFQTRETSQSPYEYYECKAEVARMGLETLTMRPSGPIHREAGIQVDLVNFSIGGIKIESSEAFLRYALGKDHASMPVEEKVNHLERTCFLVSFYPQLSFNRATEAYQPQLPMHMQLLAKIVWTELSRHEEDEAPDILGFGMKFYYNPIDYSPDARSFDRWELLREFKENRFFREVHSSLNGLIAYLESRRR